MQKLKLLIGLSLFLITACNKEDCDSCPCEIQDPLTEIAWLKAYVDQASNEPGTQIIQYVYQDQCVYWINDCVQNCSDNLIFVFDKDKNEICRFGGIIGEDTCPDFDSQAREKKILFDSTL